jgi:tetratricopeptide (TPR) repeat protein
MRRLPRSAIAATAIVLFALAVAAIRVRPSWDVARRRDGAERLYLRGDFRGAHEAFRALARELVRRSRTDVMRELDYNTGNAAYRLGRFDEAVRGYRGALDGPRVLQARSQYNIGNSYVWIARAETDRRGSLRAAINAYEEALLLDPRDVDAKWNLEVAFELLAAEQSRVGGGPRREANWGGGNLTKSGYAGAPQTGAGATPGGGYGSGSGESPVREMTPSEARRLLEAVQRAAVTGQDVRRVDRTPRQSRRKDW